MSLKIKSITRCGDHSFRVYLSDPSGLQGPIRRRFLAPSLEEAEKRANFILNEICGTWTFKTCLDEYIAVTSKSVCAETLSGYHRIAERLTDIHDDYIEQIEPAEIQACLDKLSESYSESVVRKTRDLLRRASAWAVREGHTKIDPCKGIVASRPQPKPIKLDFEELLNHVMAMGGKTSCVVGIIACCGLYLGEVAALRRQDISRGFIKCSQRVTKGASDKRSVFFYETPKIVPIPDWLESKLRACDDTSSEEDNSDYLFSTRGAPASLDALGYRVHWMLDCLGVNCTTAQLRKAGLAHLRDHAKE